MRSRSLRRQATAQGVLILVLMEYAQWAAYAAEQIVSKVLILVLMEYAQWDDR